MEEKVEKATKFWKEYKQRQLSLYSISKKTGVDRRELAVIYYFLEKIEKSKTSHDKTQSLNNEELEYYRSKFEKCDKINTYLVIFFVVVAFLLFS
ncbi:MAG: hypothetical protein ABDI07_12160, partial [Candidatus Kryptonium sp.]